MFKLNLLRVMFASGTFLLCPNFSAFASDVLKIGIVAPLTGPFATTGESFKQGIDTFLAMNGNRVGDRTIEVILRDSGGNPATAKRVTEELVVKDGVSILGGYMLSPEAAAIAPIADEAKVPVLLFNAATPALLRMSPYFIRIGENIEQPGDLAATWGRSNGKLRGYTAVADYAPGHLVEGAFVNTFTKAGGSVVGKDRMPLNTVDFAPFAERVANANPDLLVVFIPAGAPAVGYIKALAARGLMTKVVVVGQGEADDADLHLFDDSVINFHSITYMPSGLKNPEYVAAKKMLTEKFGPKASFNFYSIGAFDGMRVAYKMIENAKGKKFAGDAAVKSILGLEYDSPRGHVKIDPVTRENIQNFYVRRVERRDGSLANVIIETFEKVPPPAATK